MALDKDSFLPAAFRRFRKLGKGLKSKQHSRNFVKKPIHKAWERLKGSRLCERFFVYILHEQEDLSLLVFFLDIQTFCQVLFALVYSVRMTSIYLLLSYQDSFLNNYNKDSCIKSVEHNIVNQHIQLIQACYEPQTHCCLV